MTASTWRRVGVAVSPVVVLGVLALVVPADEGSDLPPGIDGLEWSRAATLAVVLLTLAPLVLRFQAPHLVLVAVVAGTLLSSTGEALLVLQALGAALASYTVGERATDRLRSSVWVLGIAGFATVTTLAGDGDPLRAIVIPFAALLPAWLVGDTVRARRTAAHVRQQEAIAAQRAAADQERRRVARELHDIVAHTVSVMVIQAGAARKVVQRSPERADRSLAAVEDTGRAAMAELRQFVGALGGEESPDGLAPQPGAQSLPALIDRVREAGLPVRLEIAGDELSLPAAVDVATYRIVQEALTNALRYAGDVPTVVQLRYEPTQIRISVSDEGRTPPPPPEPGHGRGLAGMAERAKLLGGQFEAGPRPTGGFTVSASLPLEEAAR